MNVENSRLRPAAVVVAMVATALPLSACGGRTAETGPPGEGSSLDSGVSLDGSGMDASAPDAESDDSGVQWLPYVVFDAAFSPAINRLVVLAQDASLHLIEPDTMSDIVVGREQGVPAALSVSRDGRYAAVATGAAPGQSTVTRFDLATGMPTGQYAYGDLVGRIVLGSNDVYVAPGGGAILQDGIATIDLATHQVSQFHAPPDVAANFEAVDYGTISLDGSVLLMAAAYPDGYVMRFAISQGQPSDYSDTSSTQHACGRVWFSRDDSRVYTGCGAVLSSADLTAMTAVPMTAHLWSIDDDLPGGAMAAVADSASDMCAVVDVYDEAALTVQRTLTLPTYTMYNQTLSTMGLLVFNGGSGALFALVKEQPTASAIGIVKL
jgi:hypothetical protein